MRDLFMSMLLVISTALLTLSSCDKEEDNPINRNIFMTVEVVGANGKNLIEEELFVSNTTIEYNGTEYTILNKEIISRGNGKPWTPGIVNVRKKDGLMTTAIYLGEWDSSRLWNKESVMITWPNGKCDTLSFSLAKPGYSHAEYFINGKKNDGPHYEITQKAKPLLKSVKNEGCEMTFEYNADGQISAFTKWIHDNYLEEKHDAQYSYDEKSHTIHIHDLWTRRYMDDKVLNPTPNITADITVYISPQYHRVDSTKERNSSFNNYNTPTFVRYFIYDDNNHLVRVTDNWQDSHRTGQVDKTEIEWDGENIVSAKSRISDMTFTPSSISYTCPPNDCRTYFLSVLERPLLTAGLFGKTPKHLPSSWTGGTYRTDFKYNIENDNIASANIVGSNNGKPHESFIETYVWESPTSK